jgi:hypothetical protein
MRSVWQWFIGVRLEGSARTAIGSEDSESACRRSLLAEYESAVHADRLPGDGGGAVGGEECDGAGDVRLDEDVAASDARRDRSDGVRVGQVNLVAIEDQHALPVLFQGYDDCAADRSGAAVTTAVRSTR